MLDFTFLEENQILGENQLEIFKKYGTKCAITDFSILLGGYVSSDEYTSEGTDLKNRTGWWWTKTPDGDHDARAVDISGDSNYYNVRIRDVGSRPALPYSNIISLLERSERCEWSSEVEFGEYPQTIANKTIAAELESAYQRGTLKPTGKQYTTDSVDWDSYNIAFKERNHIEYEYNGKKYIRFLGDKNGNDSILSDGSKVEENHPYWIEVQPIKWIVDEKQDIAITKNSIFSGVQFHHVSDYEGDFKAVDIKKFMDQHLAKDIVPSHSLSVPDSTMLPTGKTKKTRLQKLDPDQTELQNRRKMTITEIIHNWIESGESVLLRGPSGIGKTERIKTLYPNLIYIKLTNNMFPEKVVGSINLQTGQNIPPDFAKQAILACATEEERKMVQENVQNLYEIADTIYERSKTSKEKIVILLDELLNVKPIVQSLVYTLVLNRVVETGSGLKLPDNVVVVATGNHKKYSRVAEDLAEPLEKRFDHIYDMEPRVGEWLYEYAIPNQLHPIVIGYIFSKYLENQRSESIQNMGYFYEEPEVGEQHKDQYGCNGRTNDPRSWTAISHILYAFEKNLIDGKFVGIDVENLLQVSIGTKLRDTWTADFLCYYNIPTLTVEEVVTGNYTQADLPSDSNARLGCMTSLLLADEQQFSTCRNFVQQYCDSEYRELYDILWVGNDANRMEKLIEIQQLEWMNEIEKGAGMHK